MVKCMRTMKTYRYTYIFLMAFFSAIAVSCEVDEVTDAPAADALVHKVFHATIEEDGLTKTMLDETAVDGVRGMLWDPGDVIGIGIQGRQFSKFTNVCTEASANGVFEGDINEENTYYAIYPWQENKTMTTELTVDIPSRQTYRANSFDINMAPMVGKGNNGESIHFQNLCGILAISMKGTDVIKSISLTAKDAKGNKAFISGQFSVDMGYETFPYPMPTEQSLTNVAIDCGEGVQLDSEKETYFHILLPPGTYYGLDLLITTADARFMTLSTDKTLTVKRSVLTKTSALEFMENVGEEMITDLSLRGISNCYIVPSEGIYSFDATVIGNGEFGIIPGAGFHTDIPEITPASVELLWEDRAGLIQGYVYDPSEGRVKLVVSATEGNALIAAKDAEGTILWSWHIWVTDTPVDQKYVNSAGTFTVQDRNLGATRADRGTGDEWMESSGILYEWGRKDPFTDKHYQHSQRVTLEESIMKPTTYSIGYLDNSFWGASKTIYDPCPVGYKVPAKEIWTGFTNTGENASSIDDINAAGEFDYGWNLYIDDQNTAWYPANPHMGNNGPYEYHADCGHSWCSTHYYLMLFDSSGIRYNTTGSHQAFPVRCMKDDGHVDLSTYIRLEVPDVSHVSMNSAKLSSRTVYGHSLNIVEKGFIVGTESDLSNGAKVVCEGELGEFSYTLDDLSPNTIYYAQSYAVTETEVIYSETTGFRTYYSDNVKGYNLSNDGTANSYIVSEGGDYCFNVSVKGNSNESIGVPVGVEVLWESVSCTGKADAGTVISSVELNGPYVQFNVTSPLKEGNALIAVKDDAGTILWSWHIWVTDMPEEHEYVNSKGTFVVQDRNLGATRADRGTGDEWKQSCGIDFHWGRKDPFMGYCHSEISSSFTIEEAIKNPTVKATGWGDGPSHDLWSADHKTVYDPCPVGYRVATNDIWAGFSCTLVSGGFDHGWNFIYNGEDTAWYSTRAAHNPSNIDYWGDNYMTCSVQYSGMYFYTGSVNPNRGVGYAALRCMKE